MSAITNTFTSYTAIGNREDLAEVVWNITPVDCPFSNTIRKGSATQTKHEWQTDALAAPSTGNAKPEGDDVSSFDTVAPTARVDNYCQISYKSVIVSGTQEIVNKAGRRSELSYQIAKKAKELKRDMEAILTQNQAKQSTDPRKLRSLESWYTTNVSMGVGGANGSASTARTDGTQRAFTESMLKDILKQVWTAGGDPDMLMVGPFNKQVVSGFTGNATRFDKSEDRRLIAAIDVYESDFGTIKVVPNRFQRDRSAHVLTTELWKVSTLRAFQVQELAKTGDAEKKLIVCEYTLEASNEAGSGLIADLTTS